MSDTTASQYQYQKAIIIKGDQEIDVSGVIGELILVENIKSIGISGKVLIVDNANLFASSQFTGTEILEIEVINHIQGKNIKKRFIMYETASVTVVNDTTMTYVFSLMTEHVFRSHLQVISKAYEGTPERIIKRVLDGELGVSLDTTLMNIDPVQRSLSIVTPYITPVVTLNWVLNGLTTNKGFPYFLFASVKSDDVFMTSLEDILEAEPLFNRPFVKSSAIAASADPNKNLFTIENIEYSSRNDTLVNIASGSVGAKYDVLDTVFGNRISKPEFKITEMLPDTKLIDTKFEVGGKKITEYESNFIFGITAPSTIRMDGYGYDEEVDNLKSKIRRKSVISAMGNNTAVMTVTGTLFMQLDTPTVGGKIELEVTAMEGEETVLDDQKSGEFIISSIRHTFFDEKHTVTLGVSKL
jgi:hypothetical protein|tara:strand:+ start:5123 stop:6361 length:1239 start_codon:yes stop_codon:yes gene_type:complete